MMISDDVIRQARTGNRLAIETLLTAVCPSVWRIATGLTGSAPAGHSVTEMVLRRSVRFISAWRDGITPENWYCHHTVLAARSMGEDVPGVDVLESANSEFDTAGRAFLRALRSLPRQQREAFILHIGERLNTRLLGIAMDCSASAAEVHLDAAERALRSLAGERFDAMTSHLATAYWSLTPSPRQTARMVGHQASAARRTRIAAAWARRIAFLFILMLIALAGWHWRGRILQWFSNLRALDTPATRPTSAN